MAALAMCDGKERQKALDNFDAEINAPLGGWEEADRRLRAVIDEADG